MRCAGLPTKLCRDAQDSTHFDRRLFMTGAAAATAGSLLPASPATASTSFGPIRNVRAGHLDVAFADVGPRDGMPVLLLHGWPYDIYTYAEAAQLLGQRGFRVVVPYLRGYGATRFLSDATPRNAQQAALALDAIALMDALGIDRAILGGCDWGARTANIVAAMRPERTRAMVSVSGYLIGSQQANAQPLPPRAELAWWYQYYFATERGRLGYARNRREFARLIWELASPRWKFDQATFDRSAGALDNPDHVDIVLHNYRWRLGLAQSAEDLAPIEARLAGFPKIAVPTITMEGDANGAPHPEPADYASKFSGPYAHRQLTGGIGHNLPQEAPAEFADAVVAAASL